MAYKKRVIRNTSPIFGENKKRGLVFSEKIRNADSIPNRKNFQDFQPNFVQTEEILWEILINKFSSEIPMILKG